MIRFLAVLFFFISIRLSAQLPVADFTVKPSVCMNESVELINQSSGATNYQWDLCLDDIRNLAQSTNKTTISGLSWGTSYKLAEDNGTWYGFAASFNNNKLFKLDFGNDPGNIPTISNMGDLSGQLVLPYGVEIVFNQGEWFGFISSYDITTGIVMLSFGSSLANTPTVTNLGRFNLNCRYTDVRAVVQGADNLLVMIGADIRSVVVVNFKSSFHNTVQAQDVFTTGIVSTMTNPIGLDVIQVNGNWIGLIANSNSSEIYTINFGSDIRTIPTVQSVTPSVISAPVKVKILQEGSNYYAAVTGQSQAFTLFDFKDLAVSSAPQAMSQSSLPALYGIDAIRWQGKSIIQGVSNVDAKLNHLRFENTSCGVAQPYVTANTPDTFTYSQSGIKLIELVAENSSGEKSTIGKQVNVTSSLAPEISFSTNGYDCAGSTIDFTSQSQSSNITSYSWSYGDGAVANGAASQHSYSAGIFTARVDVTDASGCTNFAKLTLTIYNQPQANFSLPNSNPFCTNQNYLFTNTSTFDVGSNPTWQWSVNGTNISTSQDLSYTINAAVAQSITVTASIPGCSTQSTQNINTVEVGPTLGFTSANTGCVNSQMAFTNTSSGSVLGYTWAYGDGNTSSQTDGSNSFSTTGLFNVTLSASNSAGCQNSFTKPITIYSNPVADFDLELPPFSCVGSPSQFDDLTNSPVDSNLTDWSWQFGDSSNGTSLLRNPAYTYATAGNYNVTLQVSTNFGCTSSVQKTVTISPSPTAAFTNSVACVNLATQFTDASTGNIKSWQWKMPGVANPINSQNTTFTFKSASTFPVTLAVTGTNNCINQITKNIIVPVAPIVDFSILYPCTGNATKFEETNQGGNDPAVSWDWNFSSSSGTGNPANHTFSNAGLYTVTLTSTRQSQCVYSVSKNLTIVDGPLASFTPSTTGGGAPLNVSFTNNSTFADSYSWSFGDQNNSMTSDTSPSFTYTQLGSYTVTLTASNSLNCTNSASTLIDVVVPNIDAALTSFALVDDPSTSSKRAVVTIKNAGNISFLNPVVSVNLGGNVSLKETVLSTIPVGSSLSKTLNMEIVPQQISYACAKVIIATDVFADNNEQCVSLTQGEVVLPPYPNPASSEFSIDWINPAAQDVRVVVFKTNGQIAFDQTVSAPAGLPQFKIITSSWASGLYIVRVISAKTEKLYRVAVVN